MIIGYANQAGDMGHRDRLAQGDHERLHDQREARARTRLRHRDLFGLAARGAGHSRQVGVDAGIELEEVQVLPAALDAVVDRLVGSFLRWAFSVSGTFSGSR